MKSYNCRIIDHDINIDGLLDKEEWKQGEAVKLTETVTGERSRLDTEVKVLCSNSYLYFSFNCSDDYVKASMTNYNDKLYEEDVVEVFIDDNSDLKTYVEIEVNPLNAVLHYFINNNLAGKVYGFGRIDQKVISAVTIDEKTKKWCTEIAVPLSEFVTAKNNPPLPGDRWLINFYRIDRGMDGKDEYSSWGNTGKINFHMPEKFGELVFS
ncbi:carbohydrate-binding family 9-like protein [Clostridium omnivorum]|uniref:Carbohydrate-binding domain-containing protein n=1 Tax=Clostridium omnivorum TaxID=1604902 RepID=A0ABQ5N6P7_9CLOT|nr:carbohydrate-binding family 9-like protein [Clostridium sp. E14]GLC30881.1 hypothetical protein bsdE14_22910 [Clostridium sp. E14]